jgi:hypothetical protein
MDGAIVRRNAGAMIAENRMSFSSGWMTLNMSGKTCARFVPELRNGALSLCANRV